MPIIIILQMFFISQSYTKIFNIMDYLMQIEIFITFAIGK